MSAELIADLDSRIVDADGREYFANVVAELVGSRWEAWLEFVPTDDSEPLLTGTETHQSVREDIERWANTLDDVYLQGAFRRATAAGAAPVHRTPVTTPADAVVALGDIAPLDPFAVYRALEKEGLRAQLRPLTRTELLTVIELYNLNPARLSLARLTNLQLVTFIATAVEIQTKRGRP